MRGARQFSLSVVSSFVLAALCGSTAAYAQALQYPYEKVLVPIMTTGLLPGAYGSMWGTSLTVRNESDDYVEISSLVASCLYECPFGRPPHTTFPAGDYTLNPNAGEFFYVGAPGAGKVTFSLRIQDFSRQSQTWGTSIPVVREKNAYTTTLHLLDVPVDANFRNTLRIYDFDTPFDDEPRQVRVRISDMCGVGPLDRDCSDAPLVDKTFAFVQPRLSSGDRATQFPANVIIGNLPDAFPQLASVPPTTLAFGQRRPAAVRVRIDPVTPGLRFWAFVSATNNETQHVTVVSPQ
jgi:hypothetical protein